MLGGLGIAWLAAGWSPARFLRAMIPSLSVAISTQSSLASLPAMLAAAKDLGVPEQNRDVGLPLAVALFRALGTGGQYRGGDLHCLLAADRAHWWNISPPGSRWRRWRVIGR